MLADLIAEVAQRMPHLPFICCRVQESDLPESSLRAAFTAAGHLGAVAVVDLPRLVRAGSEDRAEAQFHACVRAHLHGAERIDAVDRPEVGAPLAPCAALPVFSCGNGSPARLEQTLRPAEEGRTRAPRDAGQALACEQVPPGLLERSLARRSQAAEATAQARLELEDEGVQEAAESAAADVDAERALAEAPSRRWSRRARRRRPRGALEARGARRRADLAAAALARAREREAEVRTGAARTGAARARSGRPCAGARAGAGRGRRPPPLHAPARPRCSRRTRKATARVRARRRKRSATPASGSRRRMRRAHAPNAPRRRTAGREGKRRSASRRSARRRKGRQRGPRRNARRRKRRRRGPRRSARRRKRRRRGPKAERAAQGGGGSACAGRPRGTGRHCRANSCGARGAGSGVWRGRKPMRKRRRLHRHAPRRNARSPRRRNHARPPSDRPPRRCASARASSRPRSWRRRRARNRNGRRRLPRRSVPKRKRRHSPMPSAVRPRTP